MILVNLLPHREAARKRRRENFFATLGLAALAGLIISGLIYSWYLTQLEIQRGRNNFLKTEITRLETQIKDIATLQAEITALRARQNAVEELQGNRNLPVYLLSEMTRQLPDGVYINSMKQENQNVLITGVAQSNERVSELLRNFSNSSPWLGKPELLEITSGNVALTQRDQRRVANFSMRVALTRAAASKPVQAGSRSAGTSAAVTPATAASSAGKA